MEPDLLATRWDVGPKKGAGQRELLCWEKMEKTPLSPVLLSEETENDEMNQSQKNGPNAG